MGGCKSPDFPQGSSWSPVKKVGWVWVSLPSQSPALSCSFLPLSRTPAPHTRAALPSLARECRLHSSSRTGRWNFCPVLLGRRIGPTAAPQGLSLQRGGGRGLYSKVCPPGSSSTQHQTRRCQGSPERPCHCLCVLGSVSCQRMEPGWPRGRQVTGLPVTQVHWHDPQGVVRASSWGLTPP